MKLLQWSALIGISVLVGCTKEEPIPGPERLADLIPLKVVVTDFAFGEEGGAKSVYRIKGSALVRVPIGMVTPIVDLDRKQVTLNDLPLPSVDSRSVRFEHGATEQLDVSRGLFTTVGRSGKLTNKIFANAARQIEEAAKADEVIKEAQSLTVKMLEGFYAAQGYRTNVKWEK